MSRLSIPFAFVDGQLHLDSQNIQHLAREHGTPLYIYNLGDIRSRVNLYRKLFIKTGIHHGVHYAVKANHHPQVLRAILESGAGFDVVSSGEIQACLDAGATGSDIIFSGVGKSELEIRFALENGIKQINVESGAEMQRIVKLSTELGIKPKVALRLNPDVEAKTHPYISTGFRDNKFGMCKDDVLEVVEFLSTVRETVEFVGLTLHIGSQLLEVAALEQAVSRAADLQIALIQRGFDLYRFDLGGGLGIRYDLDDIAPEEALANEYGERISPILLRLAGQMNRPLEVLTEPGRFLVARSGLLVTNVEYIKKTKLTGEVNPGKTFVIVDTGMHHLLRPALYGASHRIAPVSTPFNSGEPVATESVDVVGPICESSDVFAKNIQLPPLKQGDFLAIRDVGAYGACMSSHYNLRTPPKEIAIG
jgi:diaminopimelate decarboxylase